jgi:hypothetical protein
MKLNNFLSSTHFILVLFSSEVVCKSLHFIIDKFICNFESPDDFKCKSCQLQSFISFQDLQLFGGFFM